MWVKLVSPNENYEETRLLLQKMCAEMVKVCKRQLFDQLPGGKFHDPGPAIQQKAASCSGNNISGERIFAKLDAAMKRAPNATPDFQESKILFQSNCTGSWLASKNENEKHKILSIARGQARKYQLDARAERIKIFSDKTELLNQKRLQISNREENKRCQKENLLEDMYKYGGLWDSVESMNLNLTKLKSDRSKILAIKNQLKVRKILLEQSSDPNLFSFSQSNKVFSLQKLQQNLTKLIEKPVSSESDNISNLIKTPSILVGKFISHKWDDENNVGDQWYEGNRFCKGNR